MCWRSVYQTPEPMYNITTPFHSATRLRNSIPTATDSLSAVKCKLGMLGTAFDLDHEIKKTRFQLVIFSHDCYFQLENRLQ